MKQLLSGIRYLHEKGVCHRDIKPDNIMVLQNKEVTGRAKLMVKLCDFNVAKKYKEKTMMTKTGLEEWSAPEMLGSSKYSEKIDLWSAGCVMYFMLSG